MCPGQCVSQHLQISHVRFSEHARSPHEGAETGALIAYQPSRESD
jgi:hypothetical protein